MLFEIRKSLSIRALIIWGAFILAGTLLVPLYFTCKFNEFNRKYYGNVDSVYQKVWDKYQGKNSIESWIDNSLEESGRVNSGFHFENPIAAYGLYLCKKSARNTGKSSPIYFDFNMERHSLSWLNEQLNKIENKGSYQYRSMLKEKNMMEDCELEYDNTISDVERIANDIVILHKGKTVCSGTVSDMLRCLEKRVWEAEVKQLDYEKIVNECTEKKITNVNVSNYIFRVRYVCDNPIVKGAKNVPPSLEEVYADVMGMCMSV